MIEKEQLYYSEIILEDLIMDIAINNEKKGE